MAKANPLVGLVLIPLIASNLVQLAKLSTSCLEGNVSIKID